MPTFQEWMAPVLWFAGAAATLFSAFKIFAPVFRAIRTIQEIPKTLDKMEARFKDVHINFSTQFENLAEEVQTLREADILTNEVQMTLIRDRITQGYMYFKKKGEMSLEEYRALNDLHTMYHKCGGNSYVDALMEQLNELYKNQCTH